MRVFPCARERPPRKGVAPRYSFSERATHPTPRPPRKGVAPRYSFSERATHPTPRPPRKGVAPRYSFSERATHPTPRPPRKGVAPRYSFSERATQANGLRYVNSVLCRASHRDYHKTVTIGTNYLWGFACQTRPVRVDGIAFIITTMTCGQSRQKLVYLSIMWGVAF